MNWLIIKNDFKRNKSINCTLLLFITLAFSLAVSSVIIAAQLISSISGLYKTAQPPHFLQMHKGNINIEEIDKFNSSYKDIDSWQVVTLIDVYGDSITVSNDNKSTSLSRCRLDISLVKQNESKDLLLNSNKEKVHLKDGEMGIPILLKNEYDIELGDTVVLDDNGIKKTFIVKEFILDAQMNSSMCSSTRILISDNDFEELNGSIGENEYLIEAYFKDSKMASDYMTAYENDGLPKNGQAVTYTMIFLLSALADLIMAFILLVASILLVLIAVFCIRFTINAVLEEQIGEIGTMKAIGMNYKSISEIYLVKYKMLAFIGGVLGYLIAIVISRLFTNHISVTFGSSKQSVMSFVLSIIACLLIFFLIESQCKRILRKIKKITVVDALVNGNGFNKKSRKAKDGLYKFNLPVNIIMPIREVILNFKNWFIVFAIMIISSVIILIPMNIVNTIKSPQFISYMGADLQDIMIEVDNGQRLEERYLEAKKVLDMDSEIPQYSELSRMCVQTYNSEKKIKNIHVDCGKLSGEGLKYISGTAPEKDNEIALSYLNAKQFDKKYGDNITIIWNGIKQEFIVCGIYQDVTSGGYTAKSKYEFPGLEKELYSFSVDVKDEVDINSKSKELADKLGKGFNVDPSEDFINQTLGAVIRQLNMAVGAVIFTGLFLACLITVLFLKLCITRDYSQIAAMKSIGFSSKDIRMQYTIKIVVTALCGIVCGTSFSNVCGESIVDFGLNVSGLGISQMEFIINPITVFGVCPLILTVLIIAVTWISTKPIKKYNIISLINE